MQPAESDIFAMDTVIQLKVWGHDADAAMKGMTEKINILSSSLSVTDGELYELNRSGCATLSEDAAALLTQAMDYSIKTNGAFDPTVFSAVSLWGFTTDKNHVPTEQERLQAAETIGVSHIHLDGNNVTLDEGTMLDFGGIAKGYASERCAELLQDRGVTAALLMLGGNVQTVGEKPDGSSWRIGIADPAAPEKAIAQLTFSGSLALVTSGSYQRYFEQDGVRYHHILDPETAMPASNGLCSVTVLADSGTMADAYSTALFVMGLEEATEFWRENENFEAVFITDNMDIFATQGAAALLSGCEFTVIER